MPPPSPHTPFSVHPTPDGFMVCGPHAQTAEENRQEGTVSSIYVIIKGKSACIVDTGRHDACYAVLAAALRAHHVKPRYIVLTHDHYDHVGNAHRLREEFGGLVVAHALDRPLLETPLILFDPDAMGRAYGCSMQDAWLDLGFTDETIRNMRGAMERFFTVPVNADLFISEDVSLDLDGLELRLLHTPGHSPGSLSVHVPASGSVYTGDLTFWVNPCRPYPIGNAEHCLASLRRIRDLEPSYCGHGHYLGISDAAIWLDQIIGRHLHLEMSILSLLDTSRTISDLRRRIFPEDPFDSFSPIPENSIQAWMVALMQRGKIVRYAHGNSVVWQKTL